MKAGRLWRVLAAAGVLTLGGLLFSGLGGVPATLEGTWTSVASLPAAAPPSPAAGRDFVILAYTELGMHCIQPDYSEFFVLPPGVNLRAQVFDRRNGGRVVTQGVVVEYEVKGNTYAVGKSNFWRYAASYGYPLLPEVGLTGLGLKGRMILDRTGRYWKGDFLPVLPYVDGATLVNPYQVARLTARDVRTGKVLAELDDVVLAVSDEMDCGGCHGWSNTGKQILRAHDKRAGTNLAADLRQGVRHRCNECHADPALNAPGRPGVPSLSLAIHRTHAARAGQSRLKPVCYNCHPGIATQCNRGAMFARGYLCDNRKCHGSMEQVAQSLAEGRKPWVGEPKCGDCHGTRFAQNPGAMYKDSVLMNSPAAEMNGKILCGACHNGPHAEWKSTKPIDNAVPRQLQGYASYLNRCDVCHELHRGKAHGSGRT